MDKLTLLDVAYTGMIHDLRGNPILEESIANFDHEFSFGKSYLLYGAPGSGNWVLSTIIGGFLQQEQGTVTLNDKLSRAEQRKVISWFVRYDEFQRFGIFPQSVQAQVRYGLRQTKSSLTEQEIVSQFQLSPSRYGRRLTQLSSEAWRASLAIGYASGKRIFCFPHIGYMHSNIFEEYASLWLKNVMQFMLDEGALIIIPSDREEAKYSVDEFVYI